MERPPRSACAQMPDPGHRGARTPSCTMRTGRARRYAAPVADSRSRRRPEEREQTSGSSADVRMHVNRGGGEDMNRSELAADIATRTSLPKSAADRVVGAVFIGIRMFTAIRRGARARPSNASGAATIARCESPPTPAASRAALQSKWKRFLAAYGCRRSAARHDHAVGRRRRGGHGHRDLHGAASVPGVARRPRRGGERCTRRPRYRHRHGQRVEPQDQTVPVRRDAICAGIPEMGKNQ